MTRNDLVLVTGASGFVAKHTIHQLLEAGYRIRGTVRNEKEADIVRKAFDVDNIRLSLFTADLTSDEGWEDAVKDCRFVMHIASPYPLGLVRDRAEIVRVAKDGTIKVVKIALNTKTVERILVVSSVYAMMYPAERPQTQRGRNVEQVLNEDSWTDITDDSITGYPFSKAVAERAVWDLAESMNARDKITVINPAMVWGPMYDNVLSTSSEIARLYFAGLYPAAPASKYPIVDVRDVAKLMVTSLTAESVGGHRLLACGGSLTLVQMGQVLAAAFPYYAKKMPQYTLPNWMAYLLSFVDSNVYVGVPDLGYDYKADNAYVTELTGVRFRSPNEAVCVMGQSLVEHGYITDIPFKP